MQWLDSLRAIAALLVVFQHYFYDRFFITVPGGLYLEKQYEIFRAVNFGKIGVVVFFFISGFIIPQSLLNTNCSHPIRKFAIARFFRLYPAYWVSAIVAAYLYSKLLTWQFLLNLTMLQQFIGTENLIGVYWTLQIELIFYAICAGLVYWDLMASEFTAINMYFIWGGVALIMAGLRYSTGYALPVAIPFSLMAMFLGNIFYWWSIGSPGVSTKRMQRFAISYIIILLPICLLAYSKDTGLSQRWYSYFVSYFIAMNMFFFFSTKCRINNKILIYLGLISYSIYLFHPLCHIALIPNTIKLSGFFNDLFNLALTIFVATVIYYGVEKPARMIGKLLSRQANK